jgi:ketosteroid isomerase-like protein
VVHDPTRGTSHQTADASSIRVAFSDGDGATSADPSHTAFDETARQELLARFDDAWNRADVDELLDCVTDDCVYSASVGSEPGRTYRGRSEVRKGFEGMLAHDAAAERRSGQSWLFGDHAVALWSFIHRGHNGGDIEVKGIDLFQFEGDRIRLKDAYRKTYPMPRPTTGGSGAGSS